MTYADNRELRLQMFNAYRARGAQGNENDNRDILGELANLRAERAVILGYPNHSAYQLETRMAKTPEKVESFLLEVWKPGLQKADTELAEMQQIVQEEGHDFIIEGHDWWYYAEKLRIKKYAMDENVIKPYFELGNVRDGAFHVANKLFGVTFKPLQDVPVWNEVVQPYTVYDADGEFLGVFMLDYYARDTKRGGAWMSSYRQTSNMQGKNIRPIITNNLNVAVPAEGEDTLLSYDQVETLFHEFGHGLHGLLTQVRARGITPSFQPSSWNITLPSLRCWKSTPGTLKRVRSFRRSWWRRSARHQRITRDSRPPSTSRPRCWI
jgi:peptidyl-dipeptidase Dcp